MNVHGQDEVERIVRAPKLVPHALVASCVGAKQGLVRSRTPNKAEFTGYKVSPMVNKISIALTCIALASCAFQSEVLKLSEDTYQAAATASPARGGATGAREMALTNANKKCESLDKKIEVADIQIQYAFPAASAATVTFKCK